MGASRWSGIKIIRSLQLLKFVLIHAPAGYTFLD